MHSSSFLSLLLPVLPGLVTAQAADPKCRQGLQWFLYPLQDYPPAETYCSSKYPAQTKTVTAKPATITIPVTANAAVVIVTNTVAAQTITATAMAATITSIVSVTVATQTVTVQQPVSSAPVKVKRNINIEARAPANDQKAALFTNLINQAKAVASTFCSCANPAPQTTITPTVTATSTTTPTTTTTTTVTPLTTTTTTSTPVFVSITSITATVTETKAPRIGPTPSFCPVAQVFITGQTGPAVGCKENCYCDSYVGGGTGGFCNDSYMCGINCNTNDDCGPNHMCLVLKTGQCNGNTCAPILPCGEGTAVVKRGARGVPLKEKTSMIGKIFRAKPGNKVGRSDGDV